MSRCLSGEYEHKLDAKGRLIMPLKLRSELGESFMVTKGIDCCLYVYGMTEWEEFVEIEKHKNYWQTAHSNSEYMMEYAQIERKPFPHFFVDVGCWECYSVDVKDAHQKISKTLHRLERRKQI